MSDAQARSALVAHWLQKSRQALDAARREFDAGDFGLAINRVYYACFYVASAVLLSEGKTFVKHAGVRSALHQHLVKTGRVTVEMGEFYDGTFDDRTEADYQISAPPDPAAVLSQIEQAGQFVAALTWLIKK
jgi:uncharacterized protein (UPF0332 family)